MKPKQRRFEALENKIKDADALLTHAFCLPSHTLAFNNELHHAGECCEKGNITLRLTQRKSNRIMSEVTVKEILAHELAHLIYFRHGRAHTDLTTALTYWLYQNDESMQKLRKRRTARR